MISYFIDYNKNYTMQIKEVNYMTMEEQWKTEKV